MPGKASWMPGQGTAQLAQRHRSAQQAQTRSGHEKTRSPPPPPRHKRGPADVVGLDEIGERQLHAVFLWDLLLYSTVGPKKGKYPSLGHRA